MVLMAAALADDEVTAMIGRCATGDRAALRRLFDAEAPRMIGVAERILRRRALAEEAMQDAFVQVWRRASSFDPSLGSGRTWLYTILRNRSLNILRDESRTELSGDDASFDGASEEDDPETVVMKLGEASRLRQCLEKLEPARRQAIVLAYSNGLSHGELAGRLSLPLGTIKSWIRRGMQSLKECLS
ncbi:MAG: sigma-70 family RNA polymerase sigma factor [Beijerinckiaceae bacterium]